MSDLVPLCKAGQYSECRFRYLVETINDMIWETNAETVFTYCSPQVLDILGYTAEEFVGKTPYTYMVPEYRDKVKNEIIQGRQRGEISFSVDAPYIHKNGSQVYMEIRGTVIKQENGVPVAYRGIARDVTQRRVNEEKIKKSLLEKELLLKELHHRVKNNLQVISSMLNLQIFKSSSEQVRETLESVMTRIQSMALVHQKMYQVDDLSKINVKPYVSEIIMNVAHLYRSRERQVEINMDVIDVNLDIAQLIPCALIINEIVSNTYKHAFADFSGGTLCVKFYRAAGYVLEIRDSGTGYPEDILMGLNRSVGMEIVDSLTSQLSGTAEIFNDNGAVFRLSFN